MFIQPEKLLANEVISEIAEYAGIHTVSDYQLALCILFSCVVMLSGMTKLSLSWFQSRLSYSVAADLSSQVFTSAMNEPYEYHLGINSSQIISTVANKASIVADNLIHLC